MEELFDSDSDDEHFEGFGFSMPDNQWTQGWYEKDNSILQLQSGPARNMQDSATTADYFDLFIYQQTIDNIVVYKPKCSGERSEELEASLTRRINQINL